eukprot:CAMPEP_0195529760 /NCGR_PEP_ID=MMETSP0794_2-20130614/32400_1 /TAXON_ID=515487 /ORGANISM="Stephanopyxis turris, Strain CCMP 815" /LENGTH=273 /DNA_ID=CAMNT_0040661115 /DNA_START=61 /DNA_END=882 /DNA_ORIENTATION=-
MSAAVSSIARRSIVVVYGTRGGMSDVGKFAAFHALQLQSSVQSSGQNNTSVRVVAMSFGTEDGEDKGFAPEVTDLSSQQTVEECLRREDESHGITKVDVGNFEASVQQLEEAFKGADAVIACVGNRQPSMPRWVSPATQQIKAAVAKTGVQRLVQLSSMGIGDDKVKPSVIKVLWWTMLRTMLRSAHADLEEAERIVRTDPVCDYLLVRPMGLTPSEPPKHSWSVLHTDRGSLGTSIAKSDVAEFMLQEALTPTFSRTEVTVGPGTGESARVN